MAFDLRRLVAEAERLALPFVARPIDMYRCPQHGEEYKPNWAGVLVCPKPEHQPARGDEE